MEEEYRIVLGGQYQVSNLGNVKRKYRDGKWKTFVSKTRGKYITLSANMNGKRKTVFLHRVIATEFVPNQFPSIKNEVNHIDGDTHNNAVSNLEWVSRRENVQHAYNMGLYKSRTSKEKSIENRVLSLEKEMDFLKKLLNEHVHV